MNIVQVKLTVLFDGVFWVGIFERIINNQLEVCRYIFKTEPKDIEIYNLILYKYQYLEFSEALPIDNVITKKNPKRLKRIAKKQVTQSIGTKSQQALKLQQEKRKINRKENYHQKKIALAKRKFELKQYKKYQKHKGR